MDDMTVEEAYNKKHKKRKRIKAGPLTPKAGTSFTDKDLKKRPKSGKFRGKGMGRERYDFVNKKWVSDPE